MRFKSELQLVGAIAIVGIIYFGGGYYMWWYYFRFSPTSAGTFGDMFGAITSFLTAITVVLVFYAAKLQKTELDETRKELKQQNRTTKLQRFETTFFNLIGLHNQIRDELSVTISGRSSFYGHEVKVGSSTFRGIDALNEIIRYWLDKFKTGEQYTIYSEGHHSWFRMQYNDGYNTEMEIPHYYNHVMNIFTFIKHTQLDAGQENFYCKIFITLLHPVELALIYYYLGFKKDIDEDVKEFIKSNNCLESTQGDRYFGDITYWNINFPGRVANYR